MEEETKEMEKEVLEVKTEDTPAAPKQESLKEKAKVCKEKTCAFWKANKKNIIIVLALIVLIGASYGYKQYASKVDVGPDAIKAKVQKFVTDNVPAGTKAEIKDITKDGDLYKLTITVNSQDVPLYATRDGKKLIQGVVDLDQTATDDSSKQQAAAPEKTEAEQKADVPTVDLFVMSYCPYGLQMERGLLPAIEALGSKIKFNLKFVSYTLHGPKEVAENVNQYCIEKNQPAKLDAYLKCFWKNSTGQSATCAKAVGINATQLATCVTDTNKQFAPTEKDFSINKDENTEFGVQGSPTLVVNGTTLSSGRDSASVLKAICSGFTTQPKECQAKLSASAPAAGFDDQATAAASGSAAGASCATPATK